MGVGPTIAIPKVLEKVGLSVKDVDLFEVCMKKKVSLMCDNGHRSTKHSLPCACTACASSNSTQRRLT
jgi:hypothetical protein